MGQQRISYREQSDSKYSKAYLKSISERLSLNQYEWIYGRNVICYEINITIAQGY